MPSVKKLLPLIVIFTIVAVGTFYFFGPKDQYMAHDCSLQEMGSCQLTHNDIKVNFIIGPLPINPLSELNYQLAVEGIEVERASVRLIGHDMRMEEEQTFNLEPFSPGQFKATRLFPLCTEKLMVWRLYLIIKSRGLTLRTLYDLRVKSG